MTGPLVALSVDDVPSYGWLARRCLQSLRHSGTELDVVVLGSGRAALDMSDLSNVELIEVDASQNENPYLEKWYRLSRLEAERVVFLDADTICLRPLELLLERYREDDVYARQEAGTHRERERRHSRGFPAQVDWDAFDGQLAAAERRMPVINAGVMVLNHGMCQRLTGYLDALCEIYDRWASGSVPYPCTNDRIMDELAFSAALGRLGGATLGLLAPEDAPFYAELERVTSGVVVHVWSGLYRRYLQELGDAHAVAAFAFQQRRDALHRIRCRKRQRSDLAPAGA